MLTMQTFYTQLFQPLDGLEYYLRCLVQVTTASLADMAALESDESWTGWDGGEA